MRIQFIPAKDTWELRHLVLRPHGTLADCDYPNDRDPDGFHLGAFSGERLVGIASFYKERHPELTGWIQFRLRGMAVHPEHRGRKIGARMMEFAIDHLGSRKADLLWCNAREVAKGFYLGLGMQTRGEPFDIAGIGPHFLMHRRV
ncbi:MAG: GNAT family N-acetyltransferase [Flavobacteriales bacterium]|nr:GNAT family N-acetyltransferase [Flavobacteriales bacterium]